MIAFIMAVCEGNDPRRRQPIRENLLVIRQRCRIVFWAGPTLSVEGGCCSVLPKYVYLKDPLIMTKLYRTTNFRELTLTPFLVSHIGMPATFLCSY
jgi:hypothetical protein